MTRPEDSDRRVIGPFRSAIQVRSDVWYTERLVELLASGEPGMRGGKPKVAQVLLTLDEADTLLAHLREVLDEARTTEAGGAR